jgi:3-hydroxyacyl-CoA dehydrogenase
MEPKLKTEELVELLKELYADDQYAGVSGYLQGVLMSFEKEYKSAGNLLDHYIEAVKEDLSIKNNK